MFCSSLARISADKPVLPAYLVKGLDYLKNTDFSAMAIGRYEIDGARMYALVQEYRTQPKAAKRAEAHVQYIDVQYVLSGAEILGFAPAGASAEISEDLTETKDTTTFSSVAGETDLVLTSGMYAILYPGEIHRPQCMFESESQVRKVVLKAAMAAVLAG
jgi:YhcH/YjgK/YiaL family protein